MKEISPLMVRRQVDWEYKDGMGASISYAPWIKATVMEMKTEFVTNHEESQGRKINLPVFDSVELAMFGS